MIRTTYRGRPLKTTAARGKPGHLNLTINGHTTNNAWPGTDQQGIDHLKQIIDQLDQAGGPGISAERHPWSTSPHWWEPGTFDINPAGHATAPGSYCLCSQCVIPDIGSGKARYTPLHPDACRHCHQTPDNHRNDHDLMNTHRYKEPTDIQRAGRQAFLDTYMTPADEDPDEATCDAIYPEKIRGYLSRPQCLYLADHRDASDPDFHYDHRGFRWPAKAAS